MQMVIAEQFIQSHDLKFMHQSHDLKSMHRNNLQEM